MLEVSYYNVLSKATYYFSVFISEVTELFWLVFSSKAQSWNVTLKGFT